MFAAGHLSGGAEIFMRYPVRASVTDAGMPIIAVTDTVGVAEATTTSFADAVGLGLDTATYSTTQADLDDPGSDPNIGAYRTYTGLDMGRVVTVSVRPDLIIGCLMSGGATESTALTLLSNTSASAGGTTVTDADVGTADMASGTVWCINGNNVGHARQIVTHNSAQDFVVTVPFPRTIAVGDEFLWIPQAGFGTGAGAIDGVGHVQGTTLITQGDASIASGTGGEVVVVRAELLGRNDTKVYFIFRDHQFNVNTN